MKEKKKRVKNKITTLIIVVIIILLILLTIMLIFQSKIPDMIKNSFRKPKLFVIKDECSLILSNIIHRINSGDECKIMCNNECGLEKMNFKSYEFIMGNNSCHTCNCYCK